MSFLGKQVRIYALGLVLCSSLLALVIVFSPTESRTVEPRDLWLKRSAPDCLSNVSLRKNVNVSVYVAVSSLLLPAPRRMELHWRLERSFLVERDDYVMLTSGDPRSKTPIILEQIHPGSSRTGVFRSRHQFSVPYPGPGDMSSRCTPYWVSYWRDGAVIASDCLMMAAAWMHDNRQALSNFRPNELLLPGTHNSGTYRKSLSLINKLLVNQHEDVWTQLMFGIRYFDLRVGYRPEKIGESFWINHDLFSVRPIREVLEHIKLFMQNSQEIVVVDFHRFPFGFNRKVHAQFIALLMSEWGQWMIEHDPDIKLESMWSSNQRLVVSYAYDEAGKYYQKLWPGVTQEWGNKRYPTELFAYLRSKIVNPPTLHGLWALMAELTPRPIDLVVPNNGLRDLAQLINTPLGTLFLEEQWWKTANIVATDFFLGNDLIRLSIEGNLARASCLQQ